MARGDVKGTNAGKRAGTMLSRAMDSLEDEAEQLSNLEVGDFISELSSAIRFRLKYGQGQGDWLEEPERMFTDGLMFATEEAVASNVKLQVTLSLDVSTSMWVNGIMGAAGSAFIALDRTIRKAMESLPEGSLTYAPFVFHGKAFTIPASFLSAYVGRGEKADGEEASLVWKTWPSGAMMNRAKELGQLPLTANIDDFPLSGEETAIAPLFKAIQAWEKESGDVNAVRLDIVITDGVLETEGDVEAATQVQEERNGKLRSVLLNFMPLDQWENYQLPDRCAQFQVTKDDLDRSIRDIMSEAVASLFG